MPKKSQKSLPQLPNDIEDMIISLSFPRLHQWCKMRINSGDTPGALKWSKTSVTKKISEFHGNDDYLKHKVVRIMKRGLSKPFDIRVDIMDKTEDTEDFMDRDVPVNSDKVTFHPLTSRTDRARTKKKKKKKKKKKSRKSKRKSRRTRRRNGSKGKRMSGGSRLPPIREEPARRAPQEELSSRGRTYDPLGKKESWEGNKFIHHISTEPPPFAETVQEENERLALEREKSCYICEKGFGTFRNTRVRCAKCQQFVHRKQCSSDLGRGITCNACAGDNYVTDVVRKIQTGEPVTGEDQIKVTKYLDEPMQRLFTKLFAENDLVERKVIFERAKESS